MKQRVQAGIYLLLYKLLASLPLLVVILFIYTYLGSLCLFLLCSSSSLLGGLFCVCIVFAFLVKMPLFISGFLRLTLRLLSLVLQFWLVFF